MVCLSKIFSRTLYSGSCRLRERGWGSRRTSLLMLGLYQRCRSRGRWSVTILSIIDLRGGKIKCKISQWLEWKSVKSWRVSTLHWRGETTLPRSMFVRSEKMDVRMASHFYHPFVPWPQLQSGAGRRREAKSRIREVYCLFRRCGMGAWVAATKAAHIKRDGKCIRISRRANLLGQSGGNQGWQWPRKMRQNWVKKKRTTVECHWRAWSRTTSQVNKIGWSDKVPGTLETNGLEGYWGGF